MAPRPRHSASALCAPDNTWLAAAGDDGGLRLLDVATGEIRAELSGHTRGVHDLAGSHDGAWLVSTAADKTIRVWDTGTGDCRAMLRAAEFVGACAWNPRCLTLAVAAAAGLYRLRFRPR